MQFSNCPRSCTEAGLWTPLGWASLEAVRLFEGWHSARHSGTCKHALTLNLNVRVFLCKVGSDKSRGELEEHVISSVCCGFLFSHLVYGCLVIVLKTAVGSMSTPAQSLLALAFHDFLSDEITSYTGTWIRPGAFFFFFLKDGGFKMEKISLSWHGVPDSHYGWSHCLQYSTWLDLKNPLVSCYMQFRFAI